MDHRLNKLDECIFDYLVCNADRPVSLPRIFDDIRSTSGHRCEELTNSYKHRQHFLSTCYSLNRNYKNIKKIFRFRKLYLMFQKDRKDTTFEDSYYDNKLYEHEYWKDDYTIRNLIDYMCEDSIFDDFEDMYFAQIFDGYDTLVHLLVTYNKYDKLENLLKFHNVDANCKNAKGETPLDIAISMKNKDMVKLLMKYDKTKDDGLDELLDQYEAAEKIRGRTMSRRTNTFANERDIFNTVASQRRSYESDYQRYTRYSIYGAQALVVLYVSYNAFLFYQYLGSLF